jgi:saccharopine dehydrogenase-like NADP-dependent oxidoreductase
MKNILVLGAGLVARPLLRYLLTHFEYRLVVATNDPVRARSQLGEHPRARVTELDVCDQAATGALIAEADIVVSLLPAPLNPAIARLAIKHRRPLVNTSYVAPEMAELDEEARKAGVLLLNEIGLDPGIDHMSAVSIIRHIDGLGGTVTGFQSCCGGFPAQDANTNPWGYKFSWSPRAVMLAGRQSARYLRQGETIEIPGPELFAWSWPDEIDDLGVLEIYPNRDSFRYIELYGLEDVRNMMRGTCRYPGWCATMKAAADLGLFDLEERDWPAGTTYADITGLKVPPNGACLSNRLADHLGISADSEVVARLEWAGLLSDRPIPETRAAPLDVFGNRLRKLMVYQPGERDTVVLKHVFLVDYPDGSREEIRSTLVEVGEPWGDSAMARTVTLPAAIATRLILSGGISATGVQIPVLREIYEPVLAELENRGIALRERHIKSFRGPFDT